MRNTIIALAFVGALLAGTVMPVLADKPPPGILKSNTPSHGQLHHSP